LQAELKLAQMFEVGCSTTMIALASLDDSGFIPRKQGIVTFGIIDVYDGNVCALFSKSNCDSSANTAAGVRDHNSLTVILIDQSLIRISVSENIILGKSLNPRHTSLGTISLGVYIENPNLLRSITRGSGSSV